MRLLEILRLEHVIVPLASETLRSAIVTLVERLTETGAIPRPERVGPLIAEERIRDVVHVGDRVLLPHFRTDAVDRLAVAIGVSPHPLKIRPDAEPAREQIVILVLAPLDAASDYLQVVAALARVLRKQAAVDLIASATSPADVLAIPEIRDLAVQPQLLVRDVMAQRVYRASPGTSVRELLELMGRHKLKVVPIVGEKYEVLGIVTDRDILRHLLPAIGRIGAGDPATAHESDAALYDAPVRDIMSRSVMCVSEDQTVSEVVSTMVNKDVDRLPVVHRGRLTGFLTRTDIVRKLFPE